METALRPPLAPMLARLARELPTGPGLVYEPKWDGFRCLVFRDESGDIDLRSRNDRPLARYFPELVDAFAPVTGPPGRGVSPQTWVLDGEIVVPGPGGFDFSALLARLHPAASRVERLRRETPASFIAFDAPAVGGTDLRDRPFAERRARLEGLLAGSGPPLHVTMCTADPAVAAGWLDLGGGGIDGVVVKASDLRYEPGRRAMVKVKRERTADCVVAGFRCFGDAPEPELSSLLLGVYDVTGQLVHVGVARGGGAAARAALLRDLAPFVTGLPGHPWEAGFGLGPSPLGRLKGAAGRWTPDLDQDWVPVRPVLVAEVAYDQLDVDKFRHPARFRRWRPDRDPGSCTLDQFAEAADAALLLARVTR